MYDVAVTVPTKTAYQSKTAYKSRTAYKSKTDRPGWIPSNITENWDKSPYAYQTEEEMMPAGGLHGKLVTYMGEVLQSHLETKNLMFLFDVFLLYRDQLKVKRRVAPDLLLMPLAKSPPSSYDLDVRKPPQCLIEITSPDSHLKDLETHVPFYFGLGVETYFVVDAITPQEKLREQINLHLWRKEKGQPYREIEADSSGYFLLPEMKVKIQAQQQRLIFVDAVTGEVLFDMKRFRQALEEAEQRAEVAKQESKKAKQEAKVAKQRAEVAEQESKVAKQRAEAAEQQVKEKALETARKMLAKGYDLTEIAELTELSPDELAALTEKR